jgi:5'-nucleotidase
MTSSSTTSSIQDLVILHFNDVYNVEGQLVEPKGGASRFITAIHHFTSDKSLTLFSGDVFAPSVVSTVTRGKHLVPILNQIGIDCAVYGNHDFDFGVDILLENAEKTNFPWLNSNCYEVETQTLLANGEPFHIIERNGVKVGLVGLVEEDWVSTLSTVEAEDVHVKDFCVEGRRLAIELKEKHGCHIVIALTHMRWPNDEKLAAEVSEIDLILGGHDHDFGVKLVNGRYVIKSGTDFRQFGKLDLRVNVDEKRLESVEIKEIRVDSSWEPDAEIQKYVSKVMENLEEKLKLEIGRVEVPLDLTFAHIRTRETNAGNMVADIMLRAVDADIAILNSGTLRSDTIVPPGPYTLRDLQNMLPIMDPLVVVEVTGDKVITVLENGVSQFPKLEGRFPQVSGVSFAFDPNLPPGKRILLDSVMVQDAPIQRDGKYRLCVKHYMAQGKDGYDVLRNCPVLLDEENGPILSVAVQNYFRAIAVMNGFAKSLTKHRMSLVSICNRKKLSTHAPEIKKKVVEGGKTSALQNWSHIKTTIVAEEKRFCRIEPQVEGRIQVVYTEEDGS